MNSNKEYVLDSEHFIVSKTDLRGTIKYVNRYFIEISGYSEAELIGKPHNFIRHPDMPKVVFKMLWDTIKSGEEFWGYVKNRTRDGGYYWVLAHVTQSYDYKTNALIGYHSDRRAPEKKALEVIQPLYETLRQLEQTQGVNAAEAHLNALLKEKEISYDEFIFNL